MAGPVEEAKKEIVEQPKKPLSYDELMAEQRRNDEEMKKKSG